jgi:hypothetical protein
VPTGALAPVSASGGPLSLGDGSGVAGGVDASGGTSGVVGGVVEGLGLVGGGVVSSAGGCPPAGVVGVTGVAGAVGVDSDGVGVDESDGLGVHGCSPPFHAAMRW